MRQYADQLFDGLMIQLRSIQKLTAGEYHSAVVLLQLLLSDQPSNVSILYNLGMASSPPDGSRPRCAPAERRAKSREEKAP
jgi:hypothetical protein